MTTVSPAKDEVERLKGVIAPQLRGYVNALAIACEQGWGNRGADEVAEELAKAIAAMSPVDRLREALEAILDFKPSPRSAVPPHSQIAIFAKKTARDALSSPEPVGEATNE